MNEFGNEPRSGKKRDTAAPIEIETMLISDLHLGTKDSKANECRRFLKQYRMKRLVLVGDIIDAWALKRGSAWRPEHTRFVRFLLKKMEKEQCEVIYLRGNHDDIIERILPFSLGNLRMQKEYVLNTRDGRRYLCVHGDGFDSISTNHRWVAVLGSAGYDFLLWFNRLYNGWRHFRGKEYYSVSKTIKNKVKSAVNFLDKYEEQLENMATRRHCDGIIAGHIHHPADRRVGGSNIRYMNCGDWVETMSAVIEHTDGRIETVLYCAGSGHVVPLAAERAGTNPPCPAAPPCAPAPLPGALPLCP